MKVLLLLDNPKGVRQGYFCIDPFAPTDDPHGRSAASLINFRGSQDQDPGLGRHLEANEAEEIVAEHILEYIPVDLVEHALVHWVSRLRHKGKLALTFTDARRVMAGVQDGRLNLEEANTLLMGEQSTHWDYKKSLLSMLDVTEKLRKLGLTITQAYFTDFDSIIIAQRS